MGKSRQLTYRQALTELERIVGEMEAEDIDVDVLAEKVRRATFLITLCRGRLRSAEEEVKRVLADPAEHLQEDSPEDSPKNLRDLPKNNSINKENKQEKQEPDALF
ncbi:MAG: exodeoxyribonuclease VII small subunit [Thermodesulfovibrionales bacterium]